MSRAIENGFVASPLVSCHLAVRRDRDLSYVFKIDHVRSPRNGVKRTCQSPALIKAKHYTRTSEPVGRRHATAGHIVEGAVAECILFRRRDLGCLILSGILEAIERFGLRLRIRVLPIGHIQSPLSSMLIG